MNLQARFVAVCLSVCLAATSVAASKQPIKKPKHDPNLPTVELFDAIEEDRQDNDDTQQVHFGRVVPIYPLTAGLHQKTMRALMKMCRQDYHYNGPSLASVDRA